MNWTLLACCCCSGLRLVVREEGRYTDPRADPELLNPGLLKVRSCRYKKSAAGYGKVWYFLFLRLCFQVMPCLSVSRITTKSSWQIFMKLGRLVEFRKINRLEFGVDPNQILDARWG